MLSLLLILASPAVQAPVAPDSIPARVAAIFAPYARSDAPGCAIGAFRAGRVLYSGAFGMADLAQRIPLSDTTVMPIASMSKQFTAFTVLLLAAEGKLRLDDDVRRYVPEVPVLGPPITLRALLNHTSGLRDSWNLFDMAGWRISDVETEDDMLWLIRRQRAPESRDRHASSSTPTPATTCWLCSSERVSGLPFRRLLAERVFAPLGMTRSDIQATVGQVIPGIATGYWGHDPAELRIARRPFAFAGGTGVVSTIRDLARWDANFYTPRVGTRALQDSMSVPGRLANGTVIGYGQGLYIARYKGRRMISHAGSDPGYKADFIRFPEDSLTVTVLCNAFDIAPTPLALQVADLFLPRIEAAAAAPAPAADSAPAIAPRNCLGDSTGTVARATAIASSSRTVGCCSMAAGRGKFPLAPLGGNAYRLTAAPRRFILTFAASPKGRITMEENHRRLAAAHLRAGAQLGAARHAVSGAGRQLLQSGAGSELALRPGRRQAGAPAPPHGARFAEPPLRRRIFVSPRLRAGIQPGLRRSPARWR